MEQLEEYFNQFSDECEEWDYKTHGWYIPCSDRAEQWYKFQEFICDPEANPLEGFKLIDKEYDPIDEDSWGDAEYTHIATFSFGNKLFRVRLNQSSWDDLGQAAVLRESVEEVK